MFPQSLTINVVHTLHPDILSALQMILTGAMPQIGSVTQPAIKAEAPSLAKYEPAAKTEAPATDDGAATVEKRGRGRPPKAAEPAKAVEAPKPADVPSAESDLRKTLREEMGALLKADPKNAERVLAPLYSRFKVTKGSELKPDQIKAFYDALQDAKNGKAPEVEADAGDDW